MKIPFNNWKMLNDVDCKFIITDPAYIHIDNFPQDKEVEFIFYERIRKMKTKGKAVVSLNKVKFKDAEAVLYPEEMSEAVAYSELVLKPKGNLTTEKFSVIDKLFTVRKMRKMNGIAIVDIKCDGGK